jgi:hypothetical protein
MDLPARKALCVIHIQLADHFQRTPEVRPVRFQYLKAERAATLFM